tara:strand:+ start:251 stop:409 length:159 start_codon:yes stop_codon:yes gene_type:complete
MQEKTYFLDSKGNKVVGVLSTNNNNLPIVILCHGLTSSKESATCKTMEQILS